MQNAVQHRHGYTTGAVISITSMTATTIAAPTTTGTTETSVPDILSIEMIGGNVVPFEGEEQFTNFQNLVLSQLAQKKLSLESHVQHLLSLSSILLVAANNHPDVRRVFVNIQEIRNDVGNRLGINHQQFPQHEILHVVNTFQQLLRNEDREEAENRLRAIRNRTENMDARRLLKYLIKAVEVLPLEEPNEEVLEQSLSTRQLQPMLQSFFEDLDNPLNRTEFNFTGGNNSESRTNNLLTKRRPDGIITRGGVSLGFVEIKRLSQARSHKRANLDLYRLGIFSKNAIDQNSLRYDMAIQCFGTNSTFYLVEKVPSGIYQMTEVKHCRLPMCLQDLPEINNFGKKAEVVVK